MPLDGEVTLEDVGRVLAVGWTSTKKRRWYGGMKKQESTSYYQRKVLEAQNEQAYWQAKIDQAPPGINHNQLDFWRDRVQHWKRQERIYQARFEELQKSKGHQ